MEQQKAKARASWAGSGEAATEKVDGAAVTTTFMADWLESRFESDLARARKIDPDTWHRRSGVDKVLEAGARAPSGSNIQPWHAYVLGPQKKQSTKSSA